MKKVNFSFSTKLTFDDYVTEHTLALRCIPPENEVQKILACDFDIIPLISTKRTVDAFGNIVTSGYITQRHRYMDFEVRGRAEIDSTKNRTDFMPCYSAQSKFTKLDNNIVDFFNSVHKSDASAIEKAELFSEKIAEVMKYERSSTTIKTTAAEAFARKAGVCQDFTHIVLSLLRMDKIPCRYIAGLAACDGETHAWLEVWNGEYWEGYDPTNCCRTDDNYLILSQGRDFGDAALDRGVMRGNYTRQMQLVTSSLNVEFV